MPGYCPLVYRDQSADEEARPFTWAGARSAAVAVPSAAQRPPDWVTAAKFQASHPAQEALVSQAQQQRLALAQEVVKKCMELGLSQPPVTAKRADLLQQEAERSTRNRALEQQPAFAQLAQATSQLQRQSGVLVSALESQSSQLAVQQRLLQELTTGMLFMASKAAASSAPAGLAAPPLATQPVVPIAAGPAVGLRAQSEPTPQQHRELAPEQQEVGHSMLLLDLAGILAARQREQHRQANPNVAAEPAGATVIRAHPTARHPPGRAESALLPRGQLPPAAHTAPWSHNVGTTAGASDGPPASGTCALLAATKAHPSPVKPWAGGQADAAPMGSRQPSHNKAKQGWDDSPALRDPLHKFRRASRLDVPASQPLRPAGPSASLAAQLLMRELEKYQGHRRPKPRLTAARPQVPPPAAAISSLAAGRAAAAPASPLTTVPTAPSAMYPVAASISRQGAAAPSAAETASIAADGSQPAAGQMPPHRFSGPSKPAMKQHRRAGQGRRKTDVSSQNALASRPRPNHSAQANAAAWTTALQVVGGNAISKAAVPPEAGRGEGRPRAPSPQGAGAAAVPRLAVPGPSCCTCPAEHGSAALTSKAQTAVQAGPLGVGQGGDLLEVQDEGARGLAVSAAGIRREGALPAAQQGPFVNCEDMLQAALGSFINASATGCTATVSEEEISDICELAIEQLFLGEFVPCTV